MSNLLTKKVAIILGGEICDKCARAWSARWEFLTDEEVALQGYRVNFAELSLGLFLFAHSCRQIIAIEAGVFRDL